MVRRVVARFAFPPKGGGGKIEAGKIWGISLPSVLFWEQCQCLYEPHWLESWHKDSSQVRPRPPPSRADDPHACS